MPKLPDPSMTSRRTPQPGGPSGFIDNALVPTTGPDFSIGNALTGIGEDAYKYALAEKQRMDDVAVDDAKNQAYKSMSELELEYLQIKKKNAFDQDIVKDYSTKLDAVNEKIYSGLKNESQKKAWERFYGQAKVKFAAGVLKHKLNESDAYASETYQATNMTRMQNAHSNWSDPDVVNNSASDIVKNITKEKLRAGWGDERTEAELKANLGPLWSGVAAQYINAKQYDTAKKILDQHKDAIGVDKYTSYHKSIEASQTIDLSQEQADKIFSTIKGESAQIAYARKNLSGMLEEKTIEQIKTRHNEERIQRQEADRIKTEKDLKWISEFGVDALGNETLTTDQVEKADISDAVKADWKAKVFSQGKEKNKTKIAEKSETTYAKWLEKVTLEPEKYKPEDVAKDINPNGGGLTGPQYTNVLSALAESKKPKTTAKQSESGATSQLKAMYDRGDFGEVVTGEEKFTSPAWKTYSNILVDLKQKYLEEKDADHTDWFNKRINDEGLKMLYKKLDSDWVFFGGLIGDESDDIIKEWLSSHGKATSDRNIQLVKQKYKTRVK